MYSRFILLGIFVIGLLSQPSVCLAMEATETTEAKIKQWDQTWANAYVKRDIPTLERIMADDFVTTDATGTTFLNGKEQNIAGVKSGEVVYESFKIEKVDVKVQGNTAIAVGKFSMTGKAKGKPFAGRYAYTETWVNRKGEWKAIAEHLTEIQAP